MSLLLLLRESGAVEPVEPVTTRPELDDVGALIRAYTRSDASGDAIGTFDDTTAPTGDQVEEFIDHAYTRITLRLPAELDDDLIPFVRRLVAIRAAMFTIVSIQPDADENEDSAYNRLKAMFDEDWAEIQDLLADRGDSTQSRPRVSSVALASPHYVAEDPLAELEL